MQEIELKLCLPADAHSQLSSHPLLRRYQTAELEVQHLFNLYYDTPDQALNRHRVALRIRRQGSRYIQTLKSAGGSHGGLHQRQELEWELEQPQLQLQLLPPGTLPEGVDTRSLKPAFSTDFQRTLWQLSVPGAKQNTRLELVLDSGWASLGEGKEQHAEADRRQRDPISEIELELRDGDPQVLFQLALELAESIPLRITRISKAARGYRLHDPQRARRYRRAKIDTDRPAARQHLLLQQLEALQARIEGYEFLEDTDLLCPLLSECDTLVALVEEPELAIPSATTEILATTSQQLRRLISPWLLQRQFGSHGFSPADCQRRLQQVAELLTAQGFSLGLLQLSERAFKLTK